MQHFEDLGLSLAEPALGLGHLLLQSRNAPVQGIELSGDLAFLNPNYKPQLVLTRNLPVEQVVPHLLQKVNLALGLSNLQPQVLHQPELLAIVSQLLLPPVQQQFPLPQ